MNEKLRTEEENKQLLIADSKLPNHTAIRYQAELLLGKDPVLGEPEKIRPFVDGALWMRNIALDELVKSHAQPAPVSVEDVIAAIREADPHGTTEDGSVIMLSVKKLRLALQTLFNTK